MALIITEVCCCKYFWGVVHLVYVCYELTHDVIYIKFCHLLVVAAENFVDCGRSVTRFIHVHHWVLCYVHIACWFVCDVETLMHRDNNSLLSNLIMMPGLSAISSKFPANKAKQSLQHQRRTHIKQLEPRLLYFLGQQVQRLMLIVDEVATNAHQRIQQHHQQMDHKQRQVEL